MDPRETSPSRRYVLLAAFLAGCCAVSWGLAALLSEVVEHEHVIDVVNPTERPITITLGRAQPVVVPPHGHEVLYLQEGEHSLRIDGEAGTRTETFAIRGGRSPLEGYSGVLALAPTSWVIVRRDESGMDAPDRASVRRFSPPPAPGPFEVPRECDLALVDEPFHPSLQPVADPRGTGRARLCTYDPATRRVGCGLCTDAGRCTPEDRSGIEPLVLPADPP